MIALPKHFAWLIFNDEQAAAQIGWMISTLAAVTIFNFVNELMSALRQVRVVSSMQFVNSLAFAVLGTLGLAIMQSWTILLPCYTLACLLAMIPGLWVLRATHAHELKGSVTIPGMWSRVLPFAVALWCMNLLTNCSTSAIELCCCTSRLIRVGSVTDWSVSLRPAHSQLVDLRGILAERYPIALLER